MCCALFAVVVYTHIYIYMFILRCSYGERERYLYLYICVYSCVCTNVCIYAVTSPLSLNLLPFKLMSVTFALFFYFRCFVVIAELHYNCISYALLLHYCDMIIALVITCRWHFLAN